VAERPPHLENDHNKLETLKKVSKKIISITKTENLLFNNSMKKKKYEKILFYKKTYKKANNHKLS
jgi:hypothetical protein